MHHLKIIFIDKRGLPSHIFSHSSHIFIHSRYRLQATPKFSYAF